MRTDFQNRKAKKRYYLQYGNKTGSLMYIDAEREIGEPSSKSDRVGYILHPHKCPLEKYEPVPTHTLGIKQQGGLGSIALGGNQSNRWNTLNSKLQNKTTVKILHLSQVV